MGSVKAAANYRKHRVTFEEAAEAFFDKYGVEIYDSAHSAKEMRFQIIGISSVRLLFVGYTLRNDRIRIITARRANSKQERFYNEQR